MEISANFAFLKQEFPHAAESPAGGGRCRGLADRPRRCLVFLSDPNGCGAVTFSPASQSAIGCPSSPTIHSPPSPPSPRRRFAALARDTRSDSAAGDTLPSADHSTASSPAFLFETRARVRQLRGVLFGCFDLRSQVGELRSAGSVVKAGSASVRGSSGGNPGGRGGWRTFPDPRTSVRKPLTSDDGPVAKGFR